MNGARSELCKRLCDHVDAPLGVCEYDDARALGQLAELGPEQLVLLIVRRVDELLRDARVRGGLRLRHGSLERGGVATRAA